MNDYPATVAEILDPNMKFRPGVLRAVRRLAKAKPWRGTVEERWEKLNTAVREICAVYGVEPPQLVYEPGEDEDSGRSCYLPGPNIILLRGRSRLSVLTTLHELGHRLFGSSERQTTRWSVNLFAKVFPRSWSRVRFEGHMVRADAGRGTP